MEAESPGIPSLFIVSLPRSLSSVTYAFCRQTLGLAAPSWTSDGEILNHERFIDRRGPMSEPRLKYVRPADAADAFTDLIDFLDTNTRAAGWAYKDVVQPFAVAAWLPRADFRVLRIRRNLADVAFSMLLRRWLYPARIAANLEDPESALIDGLLQAERALDTLSAKTVDYDHLIHSETALLDVLLRLYPGWQPRERIHYVGPQFCERRTATLRRRGSPDYRRLEDKICARRAEFRAVVNAASNAPLAEP